MVARLASVGSIELNSSHTNETFDSIEARNAMLRDG